MPALAVHQPRNSNNDRSRRPGISGDPRAHHNARRSAAGDASSGARHLFRPDGGADRQPAARSRPAVCHQGQFLHLHRQWPWRLGSHASATCCRAATRCWCWKAAALRRLGQRCSRDGRRCRGAEGRLAPRGAAGRGRGAAAPGQGSHASRRSWWCRSTPPRAPVNDIEAIGKAIRASRPSRAVHGRHRGLARLHAVRDG